MSPRKQRHQLLHLCERKVCSIGVESIASTASVCPVARLSDPRAMAALQHDADVCHHNCPVRQMKCYETWDTITHDSGRYVIRFGELRPKALLKRPHTGYVNCNLEQTYDGCCERQACPAAAALEYPERGI